MWTAFRKSLRQGETGRCLAQAPASSARPGLFVKLMVRTRKANPQESADKRPNRIIDDRNTEYDPIFLVEEGNEGMQKAFPQYNLITSIILRLEALRDPQCLIALQQALTTPDGTKSLPAMNIEARKQRVEATDTGFCLRTDAVQFANGFPAACKSKS